MRRPRKDMDRLSKLLVKSAFEKTPREKKELLRLWSRLHPADRIYTLPRDFAKRVLGDQASDENQRNEVDRDY